MIPGPPSWMSILLPPGTAWGALDDYWELIYKYPRLTGGAIWDWISPGITRAGDQHSRRFPLRDQMCLYEQGASGGRGDRKGPVPEWT